MQSNTNHEKIIEVIKRRGPSLPIQISKEIGLSSLFVSAFLSELAGEKKVKISHLKVGGSPLYFLEGQEEQLENFSNYMHPREAEAFLLLKEKKILKDDEQKPVIRVALRSIHDFAVGFKKDEEIFWRYARTPESEIISILEPKLKPEKIAKPEQIHAQNIISVKNVPENVPERQRIIEIEKIPEKQKEERKKQTPETFLEEVKSHLEQKNIELVSLESYDKKEVIAKVRFNLNPEKIHLLLAYNKKKINDKELLKAHKKSLKYQLDYMILFKGELSKKLKDTIEAYKSLVFADKM